MATLQRFFPYGFARVVPNFPYFHGEADGDKRSASE